MASRIALTAVSAVLAGRTQKSRLGIKTKPAFYRFPKAEALR